MGRVAAAVFPAVMTLTRLARCKVQCCTVNNITAQIGRTAQVTQGLYRLDFHYTKNGHVAKIVAKNCLYDP